MKKAVIQLFATTILQFEAGEHEAIVTSEGTFLKINSVGGGAEVKEEETPKQPQAKSQPVADAKPSRASKPAPAIEEAVVEEEVQYTEAELSKMSTGDLLALLDDAGINAGDWNGVNTNKKLRTLYLTGAWEAGLKADAGEVVDDTKPAPAKAKASAPARGRATKAPEKEADEPVLISDWDSLPSEELVLVKLNYPDDPEASAVFHEARISGWETPEGESEEHLYIIFEADGVEDYLREGDEIYEYRAQV